MPQIQIDVSSDQWWKLDTQAGLIAGALKKPVTVSDLIRLWIDQGCYVTTPGPEKGTVVGEIAGQPIKASGGPVHRYLQ